MTKQTHDLSPRNVRQAIEGMSLTFDPEAGNDLNATIQFIVSGEGEGEYLLSIADGKCTFSEGLADDPTLTITTPGDIWLKIARKELSGPSALMTGKYKAKGNPGLLLKMDRIFSRQVTLAEVAEKGWLD